MTCLFLHLTMYYYAFIIVCLTWLSYFLSHHYLSYINSLGFFKIYFLFLSDEGPTLETLDITIRIGTPTFLYFDLYLYTSYAEHYVYFTSVNICRCVPENKRSFAAGIQYVMFKTLGLLPGPNIFGHLVDLSCRLWQVICGKKGRCFDYDISNLSRTICFYGIAVSCK